jgi:hypothetical protein
MVARRVPAGVASIVLVVLACAVQSPLAAASPVPSRICTGVRISPGEAEIDGVLGNAESFSADLRFTATRNGAQPFFLPGELSTSGSLGARIGPSQISIANLEAPLSKGHSRDVTVKVSNVRFAGEYRGELTADHGACRIPLSVIAAGPAEVSLVGGSDQTLHLQLVNCRSLSCGPGKALEFFDRKTARRRQFSPEVNNASQSPARVTAMRVSLTANPGGEVVAQGALVPSKQHFVLPAQTTSELPPIEVRSRDINPGRYEGQIYLTVRGAEKRVALPLQLDIKVGPLWAIGALLLALLVQVLVWWAGHNRPRAEVLRDLRRQRRELRKLPREDRDLLAGPVKEARRLALEDQVDAAKKAKASIDGLVDLLDKVRVAMTTFEAKHPGALPDAVRAAQASFRASVEKGDAAPVDQARQTLLAAINDAEHAAQQRLSLAEQAGAAPERAPAEPEQASAAGRQSRLPQLGRIWGRVADGIVSFSIFGLPWVLRGLLIVFFVLAGLKELYLDNTTFGSDPVLDYSSLFLWGLTATGINVALGKVIPGVGGS